MKQDVSRLAIGEASGDKQEWYPPNAFHTYWTLYLLHTFKEKAPAEYDRLRTTFDQTRYCVERLETEMLLWARHTAGYQVTLHVSESSTLDSDQLAWSLPKVAKVDRDFQADLAQQDFIRCALKCLFAHQTTTGHWRTGAPLFHYLDSGNAYCYVFETFAVLLKAALTDRKEGPFLRQVLRPYADHLLRLWRYATSTRIPLSCSTGIWGWSSGHRANHKEAESWATASVYSFAQCLRRLIGIWSREDSAQELRAYPAARIMTDAEDELKERGDTWALSGKTAASQLMTLFVNPVRFYGSQEHLEPDSRPISEEQARAAILFGPPGTSKTTLSRCVAEAIGWDFVELHASHFVADGLPNVQRTADAIFTQLLELDRTVILFDEIDELVRAREKEPDAFGRFLTTSMLPKLAELWKRRKVIYFVATNHIDFFDRAVTRAQRFDALVHVAPPSCQRKLDRLRKLLSRRYDTVTIALESREAEAALEETLKCQTDSAQTPSQDNDKSYQQLSADSRLPTPCMLAKLVLTRWDQIDELASIIARDRGRGDELTVDTNLMTRALSQLSDQSLQRCGVFRDYVDSERYEQHDFGKVTIWAIRGAFPEECKRELTERHGKVWYVSRAAFGDLSQYPPGCTPIEPGILSWGLA
ncbi:MAG: AAA family ATPase [Verrucomicrobiales bacterium]|nr:AAA family ATPase [Verrucomicrobiales bacterium]